MLQVGIYLPCYDLLRNYLEDFTEQHASNLTPYSPLVAGSAARVLACITCYPIELARTRMQVFQISISFQSLLFALQLVTELLFQYLYPALSLLIKYVRSFTLLLQSQLLLLA